jgi:hypothetical protein
VEQFLSNTLLLAVFSSMVVGNGWMTSANWDTAYSSTLVFVDACDPKNIYEFLIRDAGTCYVFPDDR